MKDPIIAWPLEPLDYDDMHAWGFDDPQVEMDERMHVNVTLALQRMQMLKKGLQVHNDARKIYVEPI